MSDMLQASAESGFGFVFGIGPRPEYDIKASFYKTPFGLEMGRQLNNHDAFAQAVEEALRLADLGCRGLIIYDIGLLRVLKRFRDDRVLPEDMCFKTSSHCMATNALISELFHQCGADSITTAHDLQLPVLAQMRRLSADVVLDVPTDVYKTKGGFIRWYELGEIVQACAPVFLKMGASIQEGPYSSVGADGALARIRRIAVGQQYLLRDLPASFSRIDPARERLSCMPAPSGAACQPKLRSA